MAMIGFFFAVLPGAIFLALVLWLARRPARARLALAGFTVYLAASIGYWFGGGWQAAGGAHQLNCTALSGQMGFVILALLLGAGFVALRPKIEARAKVARWRLTTAVLCCYLGLSAAATAMVGLDLSLRDTTKLSVSQGLCAQRPLRI